MEHKNPSGSKKPTDKTNNGILFKTTPHAGSVRTVPVPPTPGATVWASFWNFSGGFKANPSSGWSHCFNDVHHVEELAAALEKSGLRNKAAHLAMVAHNDAGRAGVVTFDPPAPGSTPEPPDWRRPAQPTSLDTLHKLEPFLLPDAMLTFHVCRSGAGWEGDHLLKTVSTVLPGRTIVAFCVYVVVGKTSSDPGNSCGTLLQGGDCEHRMLPLTPWGIAAKRARDGRIVHIPWLEKKGPEWRCANRECPTHHRREDNCDGY